MRDTEAHFGAEHGREQFARNFADVDCRRGIEAIVAIAALLGRLLAEMAEQDRPAAGRGFDEAGESVQAFALAGAAVGLDLCLDTAACASEIVRTPE
jgi:hypothetical protein